MREPYDPCDPKSADTLLHVGVNLTPGSKDWFLLESMLDVSVGTFLQRLEQAGIVLSRPDGQSSSLLNSRKIADRVDDDFLRRLMSAIEDACGVHKVDPVGHPRDQVVAFCLGDDDLFLAYQGLRRMMIEHYPDLYGS